MTMYQPPYLPVNWTDGMKINQSHFIAQDDACQYRLAQSIGGMLNNHNYGLMPDLQSNYRNDQLVPMIDNQGQIHLHVRQCNAITRGGYFFHLEEETFLNGNNPAVSTLCLSAPLQELKDK